MPQSLSFTIPYTSSAIRATVGMLNQMDNDLSGSVGLFVGAQAHAKHEQFVEQVLTTLTETPKVETHMSTPPPPSDFPTMQEIEDFAEDVLGEPQPEGTVDSSGHLWDGRIHSSSKAFLKSDGTWKLKKGVDKTLLAQVISELMGNADMSPTQSSASTPLPPVEAIVESTPPPPTAEATVPNPNAFRQLLSEITKAGLAPDYVQKMCMEVNGRSLPLCKDDMVALDTLRMSLGL